MTLTKSDRGFYFLEHPAYLDPHPLARLASESSAIDTTLPNEDGFANPGSSFLWFGANHHLNREQVRELVGHLNQWLETGRLGPAKSPRARFEVLWGYVDSHAGFSDDCEDFDAACRFFDTLTRSERPPSTAVINEVFPDGRREERRIWTDPAANPG